jgi:hypothetical protein
VKDSDTIGTLWLVAADAGHFNKEHARVMAELSAFTGMALRTVQPSNGSSSSCSSRKL